VLEKDFLDAESEIVFANVSDGVWVFANLLGGLSCQVVAM